VLKADAWLNPKFPGVKEPGKKSCALKVPGWTRPEGFRASQIPVPSDYSTV
jgi:hypothetical protein